MNAWLHTNVKPLNKIKSLFVSSIPYERQFITEFRHIFPQPEALDVFTLCPVKDEIFKKNNTPQYTEVYTSAQIHLLQLQILKLIQSPNKPIKLVGCLLLLQFSLGLRYSEACGFTYIYEYQSINQVNYCNVFGLKKKQPHFAEVSSVYDVEDEPVDMDEFYRLSNYAKKVYLQRAPKHMFILKKPILLFSITQVQQAHRYVKMNINPQLKKYTRPRCVNYLKTIFGYKATNSMLRKLYAHLTYELYAPENITPNSWSAFVLGHNSLEISLFYNNVIVRNLHEQYQNAFSQQNNAPLINENQVQVKFQDLCRELSNELQPTTYLSWYEKHQYQLLIAYIYLSYLGLNITEMNLQNILTVPRKSLTDFLKLIQ